MNPMTMRALTADAKNRALRTLLVNLATDVGVAVVLVIYNAAANANQWGDFDWSLIAFTLIKTAVVTGGSFILRRFLDSSSLPTPLPPAPQPVPNEQHDVAPFDGNLERRDQGYSVVELILIVVLVVLALVGAYYLFTR